jgi:hypothetical protein
LFFSDIGKNAIMADDATTSSNPLVVSVQDKELEKTLVDVNVSQHWHE